MEIIKLFMVTDYAILCFFLLNIFSEYFRLVVMRLSSFACKNFMIKLADYHYTSSDYNLIKNDIEKT